MPTEKDPIHVQTSRKILGVSAIALLCACGGAGIWHSQQQLISSYTKIAPQYSSTKAQKNNSYNNISGSYLAARYAASNGDIGQALSHINRAIAFSKEPEQDILGKAYRLSLAAGDLTHAQQYAERLPEDFHDPLLSPSLLKLVVALQEKRIAEASEIMDNLHTNGINLLFMPFIEAWVDLEHENRTNFDTLLALASEKGEFQSLLQYQLALIFDAAGNTEQAGNLYKAVADSGNLSHRILLALGNFYYRQGDMEKLEAVKKQHLEQSGHPLTLAMSDKALIGTPQEGVAEIFYGIGSILYALQAYPEAEVPLQLASYLRPDFPSVQLLRGNLKDRNENFAEAIEEYEKIENHPVFTLKAKLRIALAYDSMKQTDKALQVLDQLIAEHPEVPDIKLTKGDLLRSNKQYDAAITYYSAILDELESPSQKHWAVFYARGICHERVGNWPKAEADFLEALRLEADQPDVLNYLGYSWLIKGKHINQAKEMIEKAMAARPRDAHIIDSMGWALYHMGKFEEARKNLEQAIDLAPRDATLNEHLGDIYWQLGLKLQARYQWERALFFGASEPGQEEGIRLKLSEGLNAHEPSIPRVSRHQPIEGTQQRTIEEANAPNLQVTQ